MFVYFRENIGHSQIILAYQLVTHIKIYVTKLF